MTNSTTTSRGARTPSRRALATIVLALASAGAASAGAAPASADCCMGGSPEPAAFHARALSSAAVALMPVTTIEVSSEAPADYTARVDIQVGGKVLARTTRHGHSTKQWSRLRIPLSKRQRHAISAAAHGQHRRAVLGVQLRGTLAGRAHPDVHYIALVMSGPGMPAATELPDVGTDQRTRISLAYALLRGASQHLRGKIVIRTPRATFTRTKRDASQSAQFTVPLSGDCTAAVLVFAGGSATRSSARTQIAGSLRGSRLVKGGKAADGSPWAIGEFDILSETTGAPTGAVRLAGQRMFRLAPRRWLRLNAYVTFRGTCTTADTADAGFVTALGRLLTLAKAGATIVNGVR